MKALLFDFSRTLLFPRNPEDRRDLNDQHQEFRHNRGYQVLDYFRLNQELLDFLHQIKEKADLYIFTSGTMIGSTPELKEHLKDFKKIYSGTELGLNKQNPASYTWVAQDIGLPPEEILFVDDSEENCRAAKEAGMRVIRFEENQEIIKNLNF